ncbi:hypothetical protein BC962_3224 [Gillisia mitskevichiae]|uniref:Uncharacterized protein n=1 Tax=Gillisia mitskevichiae TaxID=270921 RepID=A0A495NXG0_9FLAO|nr:hypothetical protein [Gillisia mitskevichiae]RKS42557.1 hypothetical protein BC962_3224 [Gillisia mitskevichiae]
MAFESITDERIAELLECSKRVTNPQARNRNLQGREQVNFTVVSTDGLDHKFEIYKRQNLRPGMEDDFSCGLSWVASNGETLTLKRYNGSSHSHPNHLEKTRLNFACHIHIATEKYILANRKPEGYAEETERYSTLDGALHCLMMDCNIIGLETKSDITNQTKLFN